MPRSSVIKEVCNSVNEEVLLKRTGYEDKGFVVKRFLQEMFLALSSGEEVHIRGFGKFYLDIKNKKVVFENDVGCKIIKAGLKWIMSGEREEFIENEE